MCGWTDGRNGWMGEHSQNYIPPISLGDKNIRYSQDTIILEMRS